MSYYQILAGSLAMVFVNGITQFAELLVSVNRIQEFLENEEHQQLPAIRRSISSNMSDNKVVLKNVTAAYDRNLGEPTLKKINIKVEKNCLLGIIGPVGSGKSSLLQTILGNC